MNLLYQYGRVFFFGIAFLVGVQLHAETEPNRAEAPKTETTAHRQEIRSAKVSGLSVIKAAAIVLGLAAICEAFRGGEMASVLGICSLIAVTLAVRSMIDTARKKRIAARIEDFLNGTDETLTNGVDVGKVYYTRDWCLNVDWIL